MPKVFHYTFSIFTGKTFPLLAEINTNEGGYLFWNCTTGKHEKCTKGCDNATNILFTAGACSEFLEINVIWKFGGVTTTAKPIHP